MGAALHVRRVRRSHVVCRMRCTCVGCQRHCHGPRAAPFKRCPSHARRACCVCVCVWACVRVCVKGLSTALGSLGPGPDRERTRLSFFGSRSLTKCETSFPYCPCPSKTPENQRTLDGAPAGSSALLFDGVTGGCTHARTAWRMPVRLYACGASPEEHAPLGRCNAEWDFKAHAGQPFPLVQPFPLTLTSATQAGALQRYHARKSRAVSCECE